jgi:hypothetical protein
MPVASDAGGKLAAIPVAPQVTQEPRRDVALHDEEEVDVPHRLLISPASQPR